MPVEEQISDEELLEELRAGAEVLGRPPSKNEMLEFGEYSATPYLDRFGSWFDALEAAGLEVSEWRQKCATGGGGE